LVAAARSSKMSLAPSMTPTPAPLDAARAGTLEWRQPRRGRRFWELVTDGETVATLAWRGLWSRGWIGRTERDEWLVVHGFLGRCRILRDSEPTPVANSRRWGFRTVEIL